MAILVLSLVFLALTSSPSIVSAQQFALVVGNSSAMQIVPGIPVVDSPGSKPGLIVAAERVNINGLSRLKNLKKLTHSVKVKVSTMNSTIRQPSVEVCFHRNFSLGIAMCPQGQWEKLSKGSWARTMSPFDHKLLDVRMIGSPQPLEISVEEDFFAYRLVLLILGIVLLTLAPTWSESLAFYYSSAMAIGIILVVLMVLFQGMKLLPTGRHNSLLIFLYSSLVGVGSFFLTYLPKLLQTVLLEIGLSEEMYYPLAAFLLLFIALTGAWLGFWAVRKLVLTEDGSIDSSVSQFVAWTIRIVAAFMVLQSSLDPLLAGVAFISAIFISSALRRVKRLKLLRPVHKKPPGRPQTGRQKPSKLSSPYNDAHHGSEDVFLRPHSRKSTPSFGTQQAALPSNLSDSENFYSTFHEVPHRREFSKGDWDKFTRDTTKKALEELVASPGFSKWAVANADRITLAPKDFAGTHNRGFWSWLFPSK